jgi:hypothetical protein
VLHIFPPAVDVTLWHAAQPKNARAPRGRPSEKAHNLFRGIVISGVDGSVMHHRNKGEYQYLVSALSIQRKTKPGHSISYPEFEKGMLDWISAAGGRLADLDNDQDEQKNLIAKADAEHVEAEAVLDNLLAVAAAGQGTPKALLTRIREAEVKFNTTRMLLESARAAKPARPAAPPKRCLKTTDGRMTYRQRLAEVIDRIVVDSSGNRVKVFWRGDSLAWEGTLDPLDVICYEEDEDAE